jgi:drug/metabolite transporter (DMT)-like permease
MPASLKGALWMVTSCASVACMAVLVRFVASELHPFEITFWRNAFGLAFMLPWLVASGRATFLTRQFRWQIFGSVARLGAMLCWFSALAWMPVTEAVALSFTYPLFTTIGAALFLGESVRRRRWIVTLIGFAGILVILRPGIEALSLPAGLALASAALAVPTVLAIKWLSRTDSSATIVFYMGLLGTTMSAVPAWFVWSGPSVATLGWLAAIGATSALGYFAFVRSLVVAEASAVMPFDFSRLIFVALLGYALFGETPDVWTWVGGIIVFAAALHSARSEAKDEVAARRALDPGPGGRP